MKRRIAVIVMVCGVLGVVAAFAAGGDEPAESSQLAALNAQIRALEQRVEVLERKSGLRQRPAPEIVPVPSPRTPDGQVPEDWVPYDFNGRRYYVMPVQNDPNRAPKIIK
jgi:hypothetical protein